MAYFPMFIDITDKKCLVVGGGTIAYRKVCVLADFGADIFVVAQNVCDSIKKMANDMPDNIHVFERCFAESDIDDMILVVAATDDKNVNSYISRLCKDKTIPVNAVDQKEDCTFIFPSYVKEQNLIAAFSSGGNSPMLTQKLKENEKAILNSFLGEVNECLGAARPLVKAQIKDTKLQSKIYEEIYNICLDKGNTVDLNTIQEIINKHAL